MIAQTDTTPGFFNRLGSWLAGDGYDAAKLSDRRKTKKIRLSNADDHLSGKNRDRLVSNTRDIRRNFAVAKWAIERHLDYVSTFSFQMRSPDEAFNAEVESLMRWYRRAENCDAAGRHSFSSIIRLAEASSTVDGDILLVKLRSGRLQAIEADRIDDPPKDIQAESDIWTRGVLTSPSLRALSFAIYDRTGLNRQFSRILPASQAVHYGHFDRFDQVRGISPLAAGLNNYVDVDENIRFALAKAKISQAFGFVLKNGSGDAPWTDDVTSKKLNISDGPFIEEIGQDDELDILESRQPANEFQQFQREVIGIALKSLDIPYSFYDESHTNFFGSMGAWQHYINSAEIKRQRLRDVVLNPLTAWRINLWIAQGFLQPPRGLPVQQYMQWEWIASGTPWWRPLEYVTADVMGIAAGLTSFREVIKRRTGREIDEVARELANDYELFKSLGVPVDVKLNAESVSAAMQSGDDNE